MKKSKKLLPVVIVIGIVLAIIIVGVIRSAHVPPLKRDVEKKSIFDTARMYIVAQMPNAEDALQNAETQVGFEAYWPSNHTYGYGFEAQMQLTKDGEIVVLSGDLSGSDAEILYGKNNASVGALTLAQLQQVNLLYNTKDEDGAYSFRNESASSVAVQSLSDYLAFVNSRSSTKALHILRFQDENSVSGWTEVMNKIYTSVADNDLLDYTVVCINNAGAVKYVDEVLPKLMRAATEKELRSLQTACRFGKEVHDTPYVLVFADANGSTAGQKFIHYARNCGLAVILQDSAQAPNEKTVQELREYGVNAIATHSPQKTSEYLKNAIQAEKEARKKAG